MDFLIAIGEMNCVDSAMLNRQVIVMDWERP